MNPQVDLQTEFYPIEKVLLAGPLADVTPVADKAAAAGHNVTLLLLDEETESADTTHRVLGSEDVIGGADYDLALDLHCTNLQAKAETLYYLEDALAESVPILTAALAISTGELCREMLMPERVVGVSLLPPFGEAKLVELMKSEHTSDPAVQTAKRFFESIGLTRRIVRDGPGGVFARTICCVINEAAFALDEKTASAEDIDLAAAHGAGFPHGPLAWADRIGLDVVQAVMEGLYAEFKEERCRTAPLIKRLVRTGYTGRTKGRGFFKY